MPRKTPPRTPESFRLPRARVDATGSTAHFPLDASGRVGRALGDRERVLEDGEHTLARRLDGWTITRLADGAVVAEAKVDGVTLGLVRADLKHDRVAAVDTHTCRLHVYTLDGRRITDVDGLGRCWELYFGADAAALWARADASGRLLELRLPAP